MMRIFVFIAFFSFSALTTFAQEETLMQSDIVLIDDINGKVNLALDLTDKILAAKNKNGKQLIATVKKINLYVKVQNGKIINYTASNLSGKQLTVDQTKAFQSCQLCVTDQDDGTVCWRVNCSEMPNSVEDKSVH